MEIVHPTSLEEYYEELYREFEPDGARWSDEGALELPAQLWEEMGSNADALVAAHLDEALNAQTQPRGTRARVAADERGEHAPHTEPAAASASASARPYGAEAIGRRVRCIWTGRGGAAEWFSGMVSEWSQAQEIHLVRYDDSDAMWHALHLEEAEGQLEFCGSPPAAVCAGYRDLGYRVVA